ncbi:hypothetical protein [Streptomyces sp. NRRL F-5630]|uniref:hypothetical protein n=1 Tax=Streptomyces sp. NRRL F-5630 TaxID=1463864 RepID=UPI0004CAA648|nr:hypothetical protein [Streptomyces sp. NRRL F-5630]
MTTIAWGPLGRSPLWQAVLHLAALEARQPPRAAQHAREEPTGTARTEPADTARTAHESRSATAPRAPEIGPVRAARPPCPRTAGTAHRPARVAGNPPSREPGAGRSPA